MRLLRVLLPTVLIVLAGAPVAARAADVPWTERRVLNMTHQGGEAEHPSGTMYALRESLALGADMLELDVQPAKDGTLMVLHDQSVERTTGLDRSVYDLSVEEVQRLDAAFHFVPGRGTVRGLPADAYPLRGVRTGQRSAPLGYTPDDFRIPTLEEVLRAFPDVPVNIEIKGRSDADRDSFLRNADLLVALLRRVPAGPLVVVSFNQDAVDRFHAQLPEIGTAPGILGAATFLGTGLAPAGTVALQVPPKLNGVPIVTADFVSRAHRAGHAVHVWFSGQEESERVYEAMLDLGVDGLMPARPRALEAVLCRRGVPRPAGNPNHCGGGAARAAQACFPEVAAISRVDRAGRATVRLARTATTLDVACRGTLRLRTRGGRRVATAPLHFPYGVAATTTRIAVARDVRRRLARGPVAVAALTRVDGARIERARRVTLRR
ncbi:glycerophosphodiester phosphodiesterase [Conexibacter sp. W3-3-2]|uniref:glycerophosphodiester phosphodiesterase family protein n=1 Tax=Conexibacter sp. W3-3-2 TaxID=2675227 RepID=UPI0012B71B3A|nr:glycerophosphodiester phosphodiesterase family protein [Conexibacter sp. W3-3-2]MTD43608.1 glycerophosphodiester phosphodiesterase [Conexibacter sp. W3-3-2]